MKLAFRSLLSNKFISFFNLFGLTIGLSVSTLLILWVQKEMNYNSFIPKDSNVYQVVVNYPLNNDTKSFRAISAPILQQLENNASAVDNIAYCQKMKREVMLKWKDKSQRALGCRVNEDFFRVIHRPFLYGDAANCLRDPLSIILSSTLATKIFGNDWRSKIRDATTTLDGLKELDVVGVFEDFPRQSTIKFDYATQLAPDYQDHIGNFNYETYVSLNKASLPSETERVINELIVSKTGITILLQPFMNIHLYSNFLSGKVDGGLIDYVRLLFLAAIFILVMACINFMNLHTAGAFKRIKEIGMKRILGADRNSMIRQLLTETFFIALFSTCLSLLIIQLVLPWLNSTLGEDIEVPLKSLEFWISVLLMLFAVAIFSGLYPSILLTSFNPSKILSANQNIQIGGIKFRKLLFTFQFFTSVLLIFFTYGVTDQLAFLKNKDLGYDKKHILCKELSQTEREKISIIREKIKSQPFTQHVTACSEDLESGSPMVGGVDWPNKGSGDSTRFGVVLTDEDFVETLGLKVLQGSERIKSLEGSVTIILNEKAAALMGGKENIVGNTIKVWGSEGRVVGIVNDFHFNSLFSTIEPLVLAVMPDQIEYLMIKVIDGKQKEAINYLQQIHNEIDPELPFSYYWLDDSLDMLYSSEYNIMKLSTIFSVLSLLITCLGLFGLAHFSVQQKVRELSIRKILGASFFSVIKVIFMESFRLIIFSFLVAIPLAYFLLDNWSTRFPYRSSLSVLTFALPILLMLFLFLITILYHGVRILFINPILILREK